MLARLPNKTKYEWHRVCTSMGSGPEKDKRFENMQEILSLSYGDLPSYLQPCLLYLSMFPEDWEVPADMLVQMWVAEGLIDEEGGENQYELGMRYSNELVNRSMIMPTNLDELGRPRSCRVHDMILDLLSLSAQENFVTISRGPLLTPQVYMIRRLSLQCDDEQQKIETEHEDDQQAMLAADVDISHVRSLIGWNIRYNWILPLSMFSVIRVLSLDVYSRVRCNLKNLSSLKHLRFLFLGGELETELLEEIGKLELLRTLDLSEAYIHEVPASIVQLRKLEHLYVQRKVKLPDGVGKLRSLRELSWLNISSSTKILDELGNLTELRVLHIHYLDEGGLRTFVQRMTNLGNLRSLTIDFNMNYEMSYLECMTNQWKGPARLQSFQSSYSTIPKLPRWFSSLSELSYLSIAVTWLGQDDLQLLGDLPQLRFLHLHAGSDTNERRYVIGAEQHFRSLATFVFSQYKIFTVFAEGAMPKVRSLRLYFELWDFPVQETAVFKDIGLHNLTSLKHVFIRLGSYNVRNIREVEDVEAMIRDAISMHPSNPTLELLRGNERWASEPQSSGSLDTRDDGGDN